VIGLAATLLLLFNGRIAGVSGIVGAALSGGEDRAWRVSFLLGLVSGGLLLLAVYPTAIGLPPALPLPVLALGGVLVGAGSVIGSGCTSGHGVCGLSRLSRRSFVAVATFMATAILTVALKRVLGAA
jgi:uncharacterized membrane protein YedE/YeeE